MKVKDITGILESMAPLSLQESYDNAGLITGNPDLEVTGVMVCLDSTEEVLDEAIHKNCNMVVAHHPIVFSGIKKLNGKNYVERTVIKAIQNNVALYASHTNLDNVRGGVNGRMAETLGLQQVEILQPSTGILRKLVTYAPPDISEQIRQHLFRSGAGNIGNYDSCSFSSPGMGTYRGNQQSHPDRGVAGEYHKEHEERIEVIYEKWKEEAILRALRQAHTYEEIAYDIFPLDNVLNLTGSGLIGRLPEALPPREFLSFVKQCFKTGVIRHTKLIDRNIQNIALCGGAGSFLLEKAIKRGADVFVSADFKYHQFFDADGRILIADIGHFESEQFTIDLLRDLILKNFPNFAVHLTGVRTNPVFYT